MVGLVVVYPLPIGALHGNAGEIGLDLPLLTFPAANGIPGLHLSNALCPVEVRLVSALFSNAGCSQQFTTLPVEHSHAVANVSKLEKELKGRELVGLEGGNQLGRRAVVEG